MTDKMPNEMPKNIHEQIAEIEGNLYFEGNFREGLKPVEGARVWQDGNGVILLQIPQSFTDTKKPVTAFYWGYKTSCLFKPLMCFETESLQEQDFAPELFANYLYYTHVEDMADFLNESANSPHWTDKE